MNHFVLRPKRYHADKREEYKQMVRAYAAERESRGLSALPASPKTASAFSLHLIAKDLDVTKNELRRVLPELRNLQCRSHAKPLTPKRQEALNKLRRIYAVLPIPLTPRGTLALEEMARDTGLPLDRFKWPEVVAELTILQQKVGMRVAEPMRPEDEIARLEKFAAELVGGSLLLPWSRQHDRPAYADIARLTGVDRERLKSNLLKAQFNRIFADVKRPEWESKAEEGLRLARFIDDEIANGRDLLETCKGIAFEKISAKAAIAAHWLKMAHLRPELERWRRAAQARPAPAQALELAGS